VRPGPIHGGMVHPYLRNREKDPDEIKYPPRLKEVLGRTLGVPIFQEQVMEIAMVAAGFSAGKADQLRRAMAAWKRKGGLEPFKEDLVNGMLEKGYDEKFALRIFEQIKGFGEYGFPESHSASFALLVYVSAWLKCYEPACFTCALLNSQPMGFYSPSELIQDALRHGVEIRPADVLSSQWDCTLEQGTPDFAGYRASPIRAEVRGSSKNAKPGPSLGPRPPDLGPELALRLGLRMVKGLSKEAAQRLIAARSTRHAAPSGRPSHDFEELALRANLSRKDMNALAAAGTLESLAGHRGNAAWLVAGIEKRPPVLASAPIIESAVPLTAPTESQDILADYASTGLTLRRHPLALLRPRFEKHAFSTAEQLRHMPTDTPVHVVGLVTCRQHPGTAKGVIFVTLEDETGQINVVVWEKLSRKQRRPLLGARLLHVEGRLERSGDIVHVIAEHLVDRSRLIGPLNASSRDFH
jgi:error-prone DNA polymerase